MTNEKETNRCGSCGAEQGLVGVSKFYCERCGVLNHADGTMEQTLNNEHQRRQEDFYDNGRGYRDRQEYERGKNN